MKRNKNYDESSVLRSLARKGIKHSTRTQGFLNALEIPANGDIGIGTWGKIDFLVKHRYYHFMVVAPKNGKNVEVAPRIKVKEEKYQLTNKRK